MQIGFLGLGHMGHNLVLNLQDKGHQVVAWNRSVEKRETARQAGINVVDEMSQVVAQLTGPRVIWLMVAAGPAVEEVLFGADGLATQLAAGDVVIDGANSHYTDSKRRAAKLAESGIILLDCGVSGGVTAARNGACMMVGGDKATFDRLEPMFKDMSQPDGYGYFGTSGAGHYVKMVHNGIEYGMMQSLAEGVNLLDKSEYAPDMTKLTDVWNHGSIIQSNLVGYLNTALTTDGKLANAESEIGDLGTGGWTTSEALRLGVPLPAISAAVFTRFASRDPQSMLYKVVSAMRAVFGGHTGAERPATKA